MEKADIKLIVKSVLEEEKAREAKACQKGKSGLAFEIIGTVLLAIEIFLVLIMMLIAIVMLTGLLENKKTKCTCSDRQNNTYDYYYSDDNYEYVDGEEDSEDNLEVDSEE